MLLTKFNSFGANSTPNTKITKKLASSDFKQCLFSKLGTAEVINQEGDEKLKISPENQTAAGKYNSPAYKCLLSGTGCKEFPNLKSLGKTM